MLNVKIAARISNQVPSQGVKLSGAELSGVLPVSDNVTFLEILRAGWPIVAFTLFAIWGAAHSIFESRQTKSDLAQGLKRAGEETASVKREFKEFRDGDYKADRKDLLQAIEKVAEMQRTSEKKIEDKLDKMESVSGNKLDKLTDLINSMNISLAELRGRPYPKLEDKR